MKKTVFSGFVAVLIAVTAFSIASAQGGGPRGRGPGGPGGPGFGGPRLGALARFADLTDEQRKQIKPSSMRIEPRARDRRRS